MAHRALRRHLTFSVLLLLTSAPGVALAGASFPLGQLTTGPVGCPDSEAFGPSISADGKLIAYPDCRVTAGSSFANIVLYDAGSGEAVQVTSNTNCTNIAPALSADGKRVAFVSNCDHTGGNADGNSDVFLYDRDAESIQQITDTTDFGIFSPAINGDGTRIVIPSNQHLTGSGRENNPDLYMFDTVSNMFTQLTSPPVCRRTGSAAMSADGTRVAFLSSCMLTDRPRSPLAHQYVIDTTTGIISEITIDNTCGSLCNQPPAISGDGKLIAFGSSLNLGAPYTGFYELYSYHVDNSTLERETISTMPCLNGASTSINHDGSAIAFSSGCDALGTNPDRSVEIFLLDPTSNTLMQLTDVASAPIPNGCVSHLPSIDAAGTHIAFQSSCNLTGNNPQLRAQIFFAGSGIVPMNPTPTATVGVATATPTAMATAVPTTPGAVCSGDCNGTATVTVDEVIALVNIALGNADESACALGVPGGTPVDVVLIIQAVGYALNGCESS